jgi:hypothetical protein
LEGHRRTDLVRYGLLTTGDYLWPWKGGVAGGTAVDSKYNLFPIPADFRTVNPNLSQNIMMKQLVNGVMLMLLFAVAITSCNKDENKVFLKEALHLCFQLMQIRKL